MTKRKPKSKRGRVRKSFSELFATARSHPAYWLEKLDIEFGERLIALKDKLRRTAYWKYEKQEHLKGQILASRKCIRAVKDAFKQMEQKAP